MGAKFSLLFFIAAGILQHWGVGEEEEEGTNARDLCRLSPDSYNLHDLPFILHDAGEIASLPF